jgi:hypothetical protein
MKWISLSSRKPPEDANYPMRLKSKDMYFGSDDIVKYRKSLVNDNPHAYNEVAEVIIEDEDGHSWPTTVIEWFDESFIESTLHDIDLELSFLEDSLRGEDGDTVSALRGKLHKLIYECS